MSLCQSTRYLKHFPNCLNPQIWDYLCGSLQLTRERIPSGFQPVGCPTPTQCSDTPIPPVVRHYYFLNIIAYYSFLTWTPFPANHQRGSGPLSPRRAAPAPHNVRPFPALPHPGSLGSPSITDTGICLRTIWPASPCKRRPH